MLCFALPTLAFDLLVRAQTRAPRMILVFDTLRTQVTLFAVLAN